MSNEQIGAWLLEFGLKLLVLGGGAAGVAYAIFKKFGEAWLDDKFKTKLEAVQHKNNQQLHRLKARVDSMASGVIRLHQKEFEVLPEAWGLLSEAMGTVTWVASPMQQYADVGRMDNAELDEFLASTEFLESQKKLLRNQVDRRERSNEYQRMTDRQRNNKALNTIHLFQDYVSRNVIFLTPELRDKFEEVRKVLYAAVIAKQIGVEASDWKIQSQGWKKVEEEATPLFNEIRGLIEKRILTQSRLDLTDVEEVGS